MTVRVRATRHDDRAAVRAMLRAYHLTTEREKGARVDGPDDLPAAYRSEIDDAGPGTGALLLLDDGGAAAGMYVLAPTAEPATGEVKRLWIEPAWRGRGIGRFAIDDAIRRSGDAGMTSLRLSVWEWRTSAITLYLSAGFEPCPSWDPRPGLRCLERRTP